MTDATSRADGATLALNSAISADDFHQAQRRITRARVRRAAALAACQGAS